MIFSLVLVREEAATFSAAAEWMSCCTELPHTDHPLPSRSRIKSMDARATLRRRPPAECLEAALSAADKLFKGVHLSI
jgi:hypothetical protein